MAVNLPDAYSKILDRAWTLKSLTGPGFKGKFSVVGGTTNTFKIYSITTQALRDYTGQKDPASAGGVGSWGYQYQAAANNAQTVTATQDKYFAIPIDLANAKFSKDGSLDASEWMKGEINEQVIPTIDKWNLSVLNTAATVTGTPTALSTSNAFSRFKLLTTAATNALVPHTGRVVFAKATAYSMLTQDPNFSPASDVTTQSRRSGNYGRMADGTLVIEVPDSYISDAKTDMILTHEQAAAAPLFLSDYNQGKFKEAASGYYVNGRVVYDAFVFNKKAGGVLKLTNAT